MAAVALVSLLPVPPETLDAAGGDKLWHLLGYATLAAWFGQLHHGAPARRRLFAGLVLMGVGLEVIQGLVPWRSAEGWDAMTDAAGVALGLLLTTGPGGRVLERIGGE